MTRSVPTWCGTWRRATLASAEVLLVGVVPKRSETGVGLTAPVLAAAWRAVESIVEELVRLGFDVAPRVPAAEAAIWWERSRIVRT